MGLRSAMQIVTVCSHFPKEDYYCHRAFFFSLEKWGYVATNIGHDTRYKGLGSKPRLLKEAIESGLVADEYIIFCDAWDVVFQQTPALIYEHLNNGKITFNAEKNCFPRSDWADKFPESKTPYRYLNSGFSCGPTALYYQALKEMKAEEIPDDHQVDGKWITPNDQEYWQKQYLWGNVPMALDTGARMCQTLAGVEESELDFSEPLIKNRELGSTPICFHLNGRKEEWKPKILGHLGLPM